MLYVDGRTTDPSALLARDVDVFRLQLARDRDEWQPVRERRAIQRLRHY